MRREKRDFKSLRGRMELVDVMIVAVIVLAVGGALAYIIKAKRGGRKCIGCPAGNSCQ